jgi:hypothetical protein
MEIHDDWVANLGLKLKYCNFIYVCLHASTHVCNIELFTTVLPIYVTKILLLRYTCINTC